MNTVRFVHSDGCRLSPQCIESLYIFVYHSLSLSSVRRSSKVLSKVADSIPGPGSAAASVAPTSGAALSSYDDEDDDQDGGRNNEHLRLVGHMGPVRRPLGHLARVVCALLCRYHVSEGRLRLET